jgi:hypothetical protein
VDVNEIYNMYNYKNIKILVSNDDIWNKMQEITFIFFYNLILVLYINIILYIVKIRNIL